MRIKFKILPTARSRRIRIYTAAHLLASALYTARSSFVGAVCTRRRRSIRPPSCRLLRAGIALSCASSDVLTFCATYLCRTCPIKKFYAARTAPRAINFTFPLPSGRGYVPSSAPKFKRNLIVKFQPSRA